MKLHAVLRCFVKMESIVTTQQGRLRGSISNLLDGRQKYYSFKGIRYATPPIGELRFRAPLPPTKWEGIRNAIEHGPVCTQYFMNANEIIEGSEDCLYLNVYSKNLSGNAPVMVFIHGGAFMSGSGNDDTYGPQFLIQHDVVLVTINYRLEMLGFLCLDTPEVPGNAGLKDQLMALKWVKDNIENFGGDPGKVTLFGESAGAASVTYHMLSPRSAGLFHKAIVQSGTCLNDWAIAHKPVERAFRVAKHLGKEIENKEELLKFLRSVPAAKLAKMSVKTRTDDEKFRGLAIHFTPTVEKIDNEDAFLTKEPIHILLEKKVNKVPLMIGYNSGEGLLISGEILKKSNVLNEHPHFLVPRGVALKVTESKRKELGERILKFYTGNDGLKEETVKGVVDMLTDLHFSYQLHRFAHFYNSCNVPIYMYRFEYVTDLNFLKSMFGMTDMEGAMHADDLFYLFFNQMIKDPYMEQEKLRNIVYKLTELWTNFAKTGNPTPENSKIEPKWPQYTSGKEYLALNEVIMSKKYADQERTEFWNKLYGEAGHACITKSHL